MLITDWKLLPDVAVCDPLLTVGSPPPVTASAGVDALTHAIEAYVSRRRQPTADLFALGAIGQLAPNLVRAYRDGRDLEARARPRSARSTPGSPSATPRSRSCTGCPAHRGALPRRPRPLELDAARHGRRVDPARGAGPLRRRRRAWASAPPAPTALRTPARRPPSPPLPTCAPAWTSPPCEPLASTPTVSPS